MITVVVKDSVKSSKHSSEIAIGTLFLAKRPDSGVKSVFLKTFTCVVDLNCPRHSWVIEQDYLDYEEVNGTLTID